MEQRWWKSKEKMQNEDVQEEKKANHLIGKELAKEKMLDHLAKSYLLDENVSDEEKAVFAGLYEFWKKKVSYIVGDKITHEGIVYEVLQSHVSQSDWTPDSVPALFKVVYQVETSTGQEVIPEWKQPVGGHDAYIKGDKVYYDNQVYESVADANVWSPDAYGWELVV